MSDRLLSDMDGNELATLNQTLQAGVHLLRYELAGEGNHFSVKLTLIDRAGAKLMLSCTEAQNLELLPEGDALTKPMRLTVMDMRDDQLDGIRFSLEELDRETLFLHCADLRIEA